MAKFYLLVFSFLILVSNILPTQLLRAETEMSDWFKTSPITTNQFDIGGEPLPFSINGNRDCVKQRIVTRPEKVLPYWPYLQTEESHESCVVSTSYGAVSQSGYLQTAGETTFGRVTYSWGGSMTLLPVPRSANGIYIEPNSPNGVKVFLIRDFLSNIDGATLASGEISYKVKSDVLPVRLNGSDGQALGVRLDSVSFSSSGKWMVADIPTNGLSRIDTKSFSIQTFDVSHNYNIGVAPGVQSAITNNGRYVVASSPSFTRFRLYDLDDCSSITSCKFLDLQKHFKDNVTGFVSSVRLRFSTDYSLRMYMVQQVGSVKKIIHQTLRAAGHEATDFGYLGLGDSFASGEGAYQYKASTDVGNNKCHLSQRSYPYLIADELGINEAESIACSGATIEDVNTMSPTYRGQVNDRISYEDRDNISEILGAYSPGFIPQNDFIKKYSPEVITISTIGNDIGFSDKIKACLMPGTCYSTYEDRLEAALEVNAQFDRLLGMYADIKEEMQGKKVYVIGYPEVAMDNGSCGGNVRLDAQEVKFSNQLIRHLNDMIELAAKKIGFFYVDVEQAFYGHRLCEASYPAEAINGITAGDDIIDLPFTDFGGPIGNESFHPNDLGHRKFKEVILQKTNNFAASMPAPITTTVAPKISNSMKLLKDMPKSGRDTRTVKHIQNMLEKESVLQNEIIDVNVPQIDSGFKTSSNVEAWLHSEPTKLGTFTTDTSGDLSLQVAIPQDIPLGFHTIHLIGTSVSGKPVDLQKVIYVAAAQEPDVIEQPQEEEPEPEVAEDEAPLSNENTKPPENNPETVAGHEQINQPTEPVQNTEQTNQQINSYAQGPYQAPLINDTQGGGVVAASTTSASLELPKNITTQANANNESSQTSTPVIYFFAAPLAIITLLFLLNHSRKYL